MNENPPAISKKQRVMDWRIKELGEALTVPHVADCADRKGQKTMVGGGIMTEEWKLKPCSTEEKTDQEQIMDYIVTNNNTHACLWILYVIIKWLQGNKIKHPWCLCRMLNKPAGWYGFLVEHVAKYPLIQYLIKLDEADDVVENVAIGSHLTYQTGYEPWVDDHVQVYLHTPVPIQWGWWGSWANCWVFTHTWSNFMKNMR